MFPFLLHVHDAGEFVCTGGCTHMCLCSCGGLNLTSDAFLDCSLSSLLMQGPTWTQSLPTWLYRHQFAPHPAPSMSSECCNYKQATMPTWFLHGSWEYELWSSHLGSKCPALSAVISPVHQVVCY